MKRLQLRVWDVNGCALVLVVAVLAGYAAAPTVATCRSF